jgi:hypothetical protein
MAEEQIREEIAQLIEHRRELSVTMNWQESVKYDEKTLREELTCTCTKCILRLLEAQAKATWEARQKEVDEAGKVVATDIGQMLCVLAGNLMLENKEAGSLLARQLQPMMDYLKIKYIPDLPRLTTVETIINQQVAKAEQRGIREGWEAIFNWGNESCPHQFHFNTRQLCPACWDELRDKVYGKPRSKIRSVSVTNLKR